MSPEDYFALVSDLAAELADLASVVAGLGTDDWDRPTPAVGWTVRDQLAHVAEFNDVAALALSDPDTFRATKERFLGLGPAWVDELAWSHRVRTRDDLVDWLDRSGRDVVAQLEAWGPEARMPWFGPDMSAASCATARLMETWAHGQDILDALGLSRDATARLGHVCHLGVITRGYAFQVRDLEPPAQAVRVELADHRGATRTWGPEDAVDRVTGTMQDFALVVIRRRHPDETALQFSGSAGQWLEIAQAYAGGPAGPRAAGVARAR